MAVWTFFCIALLWDWNEEWSFPVLWPLPSFPSLWHIEHSTLTASSFRIWNSTVEIPSLPLSLFMVILPKAHLTSHSKISGCRGVITPSWLSGSLRPFLYSSVCIWLWGWAIHSCCSSHLWHFWKGVPVIHQCRELEAPCCNDLLTLWEAQSFPWTPSAVSYLPSQQSMLVLFLGSCSWSLSTQPQLETVGMSASHSSAGKCCLATNSVVNSLGLPSEHLFLCSPLRFPNSPLSSPVRRFLNVLELFLLHSSLPRVLVPIPKFFFFFFIFIFCPTSFWEDWLSFLDVKDLLLAFRTYSVWADPLANVFFMYLWGGGWSPHLIPPPSWKSPHLLVIKFKPWELTLTYFLYLVYSLKYP